MAEVIVCDICGQPASCGYRVRTDPRGDVPESGYEDYAYCDRCDPGPGDSDIDSWKVEKTAQ
jgi:hypothetical protein